MKKYKLVQWDNLAETPEVSFYYKNDFKEEFQNGYCFEIGEFTKLEIINLIESGDYDFSDTNIPMEIMEHFYKKIWDITEQNRVLEIYNKEVK